MDYQDFLHTKIKIEQPKGFQVDRLIREYSNEGDLIADPFMGAGTTALVARKLNRNYIGCELNPDYVAIANNRLTKELGFFQ